MGKSSKVTVGYWYELGLHMGFCYGPVDALLEITVGERTLWKGSVTENASLNIQQSDLFGGKGREGGVAGQLDVMMGASDQGENSYLASVQTGLQTAFRGLFGMVFRRGRLSANNPYIKPWAVQVRRILADWDGGPWNPETAAVQIVSGEVYSEDTNFDSNSATTDGGTAALEITGVSPSDTIIVERPASPDYQAWSEWGTDIGHENPWTNRFRVTKADGLTAEYWPENYASASDASDAVDDERILLTGSSSYKFWLYDSSAGDNRGGLSLRVYRPDLVGMNPAHIIYQAYTDRMRGKGLPVERLNLDSFEAAAQTFYDEGMGLCFSWNKSSEIDEFIQQVCDHAGAAVGEDPTTGLIRLKAIRADYDVGDLRQLSRDLGNVMRIELFERASGDGAANELAVSFVDQLTGKTSSVTLQNLASIQSQGKVVAGSVSYLGAPHAGLAARIGLRDLQAKTGGLARVRLRCTRAAAYDLLPGDVFRFYDDALNIAPVSMRIGRVGYGSLTAGEIVIEAVEDIFGLPATAYIAVQGQYWEEPGTRPQPSPFVRAMEAPFRDLVQFMGYADAATLPDEAGFVASMAARPPGVSLNYELHTRIDPSPYAEAGAGEWTPHGTLDAPLGKTDTSMTVTGVDLDMVELGTAALVEDEIVKVESIDPGTGVVGIGRGCVDTVPDTHIGAPRVFFYEGLAGFDNAEYSVADVVDALFRTSTGSGLLPEGESPGTSVTMAHRQDRPYPPGNFQINGAAYPESIPVGEITVTWSHRDRLLQQDQLIDTLAGDFGPEAGTTYNVRYIDLDTFTLLEQHTGITGTSDTYTPDPEIEGIRIEVEAVRDSLTSWQAHRHDFTVEPPPPTSEVFTTSGTWNKPPGLDYIEVICIGAGGGGASGSIGAGVSTGTANHQRGGGGGGRARAVIMAGDLPSTVTVTVGVGGASGAARTGSHASGGTVNGNAGGAGGNSSFGAFVAASGGTGGSPTISGSGGAQTAPGGAPLDYDGVLLQNLTFGGGGGDAGSLASPDDLPGGKGRYGAGGGGAGGAGRHTTPFTIAPLPGGKGNDWTLGVGYSGGIDVGGGGAIGAPNGQNGTDASVVGTCGDGGGGGASGIDPANPGSGGDGGFPGGGGGGGGAKLVPNSTSGTSGAGGAGADGVVIVIPHFV